MLKTITPAHSLRGEARVPGDKSISHRALIFGAMAEGRTRIENLLASGDVLSTKRCLEQMGIQIVRDQDDYFVTGRPLQTPSEILDCENSGTSMRLLCGLIAGQAIEATLTGDDSLRRRPMKRITDPLRLMGAKIERDLAPLKIGGGTQLRAINYGLTIASAQLKSALIIAGLYADGMTSLTGLLESRDHTERMLKDFGVDLDCTPTKITIRGGQKLKAASVRVPGDPSSAAFWIAAATLVPNSEIELRGVSLNPSRIGLIKILRRMGANIQTTHESTNGEPFGDLLVKSSRLTATEISENDVVAMIDELPIFAIVAAQAHGVTRVHGARELRVKESDRIESIVTNLRAMGAVIESFDDGFQIEGPQQLRGAKIKSFHDHRIAMSFSIAGLVAEGETPVDSDSVAVSYPNFFEQLERLRQ